MKPGCHRVDRLELLVEFGRKLEGERLEQRIALKDSRVGSLPHGPLSLRDVLDIDLVHPVVVDDHVPLLVKFVLLQDLALVHRRQVLSR